MPKFGVFSKSMSPPPIATKAEKQFTTNREKKEDHANNKSKTKIEQYYTFIFDKPMS